MATCDIGREEETDDDDDDDDDDGGVGDVADIVLISDVMIMAIAQMSFLDSIYICTCIELQTLMAVKQYTKGKRSGVHRTTSIKSILLFSFLLLLLHRGSSACSSVCLSVVCMSPLI